MMSIYRWDDLSVKRRNIQSIAQGGLRKRYGEIAPDVKAVALKERMRTDIDVDSQIADRASVDSGVALSAHVQRLSVVNAGRDIDFNGCILAFKACSAAFLTRGLDNLSLSAAGCARF